MLDVSVLHLQQPGWRSRETGRQLKPQKNPGSAVLRVSVFGFGQYLCTNESNMFRNDPTRICTIRKKKEDAISSVPDAVRPPGFRHI